MQIVGLDHVLLAMPPGAENEARRFYGDLLGLTEVEKPEPLAERGGCWFEGPGTVIHLGIQRDFVPARKAHPALRVTNIVECRTILAAAGVTIVPDNTLPDIRRFYIHDPFGNRIEIIQDGEGFGQHSKVITGDDPV